MTATLNIIRTRETMVEETTHEWNKGAESYNDKGVKGFLGMYKKPESRPAYFKEYAAKECGMFTLEQASEIAAACPTTEFEAVEFFAGATTYNVVRSANLPPNFAEAESFQPNVQTIDFVSLTRNGAWNHADNCASMFSVIFGENVSFDASYVPVKDGESFVFAAIDSDGNELRIVITAGDEVKRGTKCLVTIYEATGDPIPEEHQESSNCEETTDTKVLWLSRHGITPTQQIELIEAFGPVEIVNHADTVSSASEVVELAKDCDHIMAVLPPHLLAELVNLLRNTGKKVFRAKMRREEVGTKINPATGAEEKDFAMFHDYFEVVEKIEVVTSKLLN
jgi:hypothetical protein